MVILFVNIGNVFGATNPDYKPTVSVTESALDSKIKSSVLLDTLANMINAVASLAESLLGGVFKTLTKENAFDESFEFIKKQLEEFKSLCK